MTVFALTSTHIVLPDRVFDGCVVVDGETIETIIPRRDLGQAFQIVPMLRDAEVIDLGDQWLMPGLVDCHVHLNEPGRTEWEGFDTATTAAASGGVTSVVDMPLNCIPVTTSVEAFERKLEATEGQLHVDVGFWGGVVPGNEDALTELAAKGVLGAKAFLCHSGIDDFPNVTREDLQRAMPRLRDAGVPMLAHAELDLGGPSCDVGATDHDAWLRSRPRSWEDAAIALLIELCRENRCPVHIVHLSSASAVPMLRDAKAEGLPITVETCPHYLCFASDRIPQGGTEYKCAPPIRDEHNRQQLWSALLEGVIDFVISDHSPCTPGLKAEGDFGAAWGGISSLSLGLSSIYTEGLAHGVTPLQLARWLAEGPAAFAGLAQRKGVIAPGRHADLLAFDPHAERVLCEDDLLFRNKISPYLGRTQKGRVTRTWLRGREVFDGREVTRQQGRALLHRDGLG